jgi:hypothetical protein
MAKHKRKRTWVYVQQPIDYGIAPCQCGNEDTQWSEYKEHLWCAKCKIDFIPKHNGVFDGPIAVNCAAGLGLDFRRYDLKTKKIIKE